MKQKLKLYFGTFLIFLGLILICMPVVDVLGFLIGLLGAIIIEV